MTCLIDKADFDKKLVKRNLENENRKFIKETGGFFGLTGPAVEAHWKTWHTILRRQSPFLIIEYNSKRFYDMRRSVEELKVKDPRKAWKITIRQGELFDMLKRVRLGTRSPLFRYGHLDFCITSKVLLRDHQLTENLFWLAAWKNLKSPFYLDVTFSARGDGGMATSVMNEFIPSIFEATGWKTINPKQRFLGRRFINHYREPRQCAMANALYKFEKGN